MALGAKTNFWEDALFRNMELPIFHIHYNEEIR